MSFKKINTWLHLWLGLASAIIVFILSITGCILVFEQEIKNLTSPWLFSEPAGGRSIIPPSRLYQAVAAVLPEKEIHSVWYHGADRTAVFNIDSDSLVYVDPYTAKIVAMVHHEDFFDFMTDGHRRLWLPDQIGKQVVGWSTFIFFALLISGIILWWPKNWTKSVRDQSFKIKWKARFKRLNYDLHNVLGFYALLIALLFSITGLIMSFSWFSTGVYWLSGGQTSSVKRIETISDTTHVLLPAALAQVDKIWHRTITEVAQHNPMDIIISYPDHSSDPIYVCTDMYRGTWRDLYIDQQTLQELPDSQSGLKDATFATWLRRSNYSLHVGQIGGLATKIIYFLGSLICASLPITGFYIWWGKKKITKKRKPYLLKN